MTDMAWANHVEDAKMAGALAIWHAPNREAAIAVAIDQFGEHGEKMLAMDEDAPPHVEPARYGGYFGPCLCSKVTPNNERFAQGVLGYADDRIADGPSNGWSSFEVNKVVCPGHRGAW